MLRFNRILYHPIIRGHRCRFSCRDVFSIFRNIGGYPGLILGSLLFRCSSFRKTGAVAAMMGPGCPELLSCSLSIISSRSRHRRLSLSLPLMMIFWGLLMPHEKLYGNSKLCQSQWEEAYTVTFSTTLSEAYPPSTNSSTHKIQGQQYSLFTLLLPEPSISIYYSFFLTIESETN